MAENSSKSDQIRKLREIRMLAREKVIADCEADAKRAGKSFAPRERWGMAYRTALHDSALDSFWLPADRA